METGHEKCNAAALVFLFTSRKSTVGKTTISKLVRLWLSPKGTLCGIVSLSARTEVDKESRIVRLEELKVTDVAFPTAGFRQTDLSDLVRQRFSIWPRTISLDRSPADLSLTQAEAAAESTPLKNEPHRIIFSSVPSVLILIEGEPVFRAVTDSSGRGLQHGPS